MIPVGNKLNADLSTGKQKSKLNFDSSLTRRTIDQLTGTKRPKIEKQKAPISPINGEIVGTATAITTASVTSTVLKVTEKKKKNRKMNLALKSFNQKLSLTARRS